MEAVASADLEEDDGGASEGPGDKDSDKDVPPSPRAGGILWPSGGRWCFGMGRKVGLGSAAMIDRPPSAGEHST